MVLGQSRSVHRNAHLCEFPIVVDKLKYLIRSPVIRHPLVVLAGVVPPPCVVASTAACSPRVVGRRTPRATTLPPTSRHCVLLLPPPSLSSLGRAVHCRLLLPPTAGVDQLHRSSRIFVRHLLSFSSSPIPYLLRSGLSSGAPPAPVPTMPGGPPVAAPPPSVVSFTLVGLVDRAIHLEQCLSSSSPPSSPLRPRRPCDSMRFHP